MPQVEPKESRRGIVVDTQNVGKMSPEVHQENLKIAAEKMELETNVQYCKAAGIEWLEVSPDLLKHFCGGQHPEVGYMIYKDIRLCLKDTAEDIARRERMTCHQILFKDEGYMKVR